MNEPERLVVDCYSLSAIWGRACATGTVCVFQNQTKDGAFTASPPSVGAYAHNIQTEKRKTLLLVSCVGFCFLD